MCLEGRFVFGVNGWWMLDFSVSRVGPVTYPTRKPQFHSLTASIVWKCVNIVYAKDPFKWCCDGLMHLLLDKLLKDLGEALGFLCTVQVIFALDRKVRHTTDGLCLCLHHFLIDFLPRVCVVHEAFQCGVV